MYREKRVYIYKKCIYIPTFSGGWNAVNKDLLLPALVVGPHARPQPAP